MTKRLRINGARLWDSIMAMAKIAALPGGGCGRLALTEDDKQARDLFSKWCQASGCTMKIDDMGNMYARREGTNPDALPIAIGSHLDTQPHGGKFDGVFGVLAGLEVIRTLNEFDITTNAPIEIINWTNEEGARFAPAMLSSGVYAGLFDRDFALSRQDGNGQTFEEALNLIGYAGDEACGAHKLGAFLEAHIEQGPILEREEKVIGIVEGGQGQRWFDVTVRGRDAHTGSTPMLGRRDALVASAKLVLAVQDIAKTHAPDAVATVGEMHVLPNSRNTIPGEVTFTVDIRHPNEDVLMDMKQALYQAIGIINDVEIKIEEIWVSPPVVFDRQCVEAVSEAVDNLGYPARRMISGAGHDAIQVSHKVPTTMVFVPCAGGISHNEAESAKPEHLEAGANVLLYTALKLAEKGNF